MRRNTIKSHGGGGGDYNGPSVPSGAPIKCEGGSGAKNGTENNSFWHQNSGCVDSVGRKSPTQNIISMEKRWNFASPPSSSQNEKKSFL